MQQEQDDFIAITLTADERKLLLEQCPGLDERVVAQLRFGLVDGDGFAFRLSPELFDSLLDAIEEEFDREVPMDRLTAFGDLYAKLAPLWDAYIDSGEPDEEDEEGLLADLMAGAPAQSVVSEILAAAGVSGLDEDPAVVEEYSDRIEEAMRSHPLTIFCGLSLLQVKLLIATPWEDPDFPIRFNEDLTLADLTESTLFKNARILMEAVGEAGEVKATASGTLTLKFIRLVAERMDIDADTTIVLNTAKRLHEYDVPDLYIARLNLTIAGLIRLNKGKFTLTKKGGKLLRPENAGKLFALLVQTFLHKFDLGYLSPVDDDGAIQQTLAYSLYMVQRHMDEFQDLDFLAPRLILPGTFVDSPSEEQMRLVTQTILAQVMCPLEQLGLIEFGPERSSSNVLRCRKRPLFDKFMSFHFDLD